MPTPPKDDAITSPFAVVHTAEEKEKLRVEAFRQEAAKQTEKELATLAAQRANKEAQAKEEMQRELSEFAAATTETILEQAKKEASESVTKLDSTYARHADAVVSSLTKQVLAGSFFSDSKR